MSVDVFRPVQQREELSQGAGIGVHIPPAVVLGDRAQDLRHLAADDLARHVREPIAPQREGARWGGWFVYGERET